MITLGSPLAPQPKDDDLTGKKVGEYDILTRIGAGGMGVVYEGVQPVIGKRVAVKVLLPQLSADAELVERFLSEARAVNAIRHRGIIDIFSFGQLPNGSHYFVMEFLDGDPFDKLIKVRAPLPAYEVLCWTEEVLDALDAAHSTGIIHRDIKPSNLYLVNPSRGRAYVKLLDFGIAKLGALKGEATPQTRASVIIGTPDYMSPEQARGRNISPATDLYALGCVLFELLTGKRLFKGENPMQTMFMHVENQPPRLSEHVPDIPPELDELLLWTLEKDPAKRPATASELKQHVEALKAVVPNDTTQSFTALPRISSSGGPATPGPGSGSRPRMGTPAPRSSRKVKPVSVVETKEPLPPEVTENTGDRTRIVATPTREEPKHEPAPTRVQVTTDPAALASAPVDEEPLVIPKSPLPKIVLLGALALFAAVGTVTFLVFRNPTAQPIVVAPPPERPDDAFEADKRKAAEEKAAEDKLAADKAAADKQAAEQAAAEKKATADEAAAEKKAAAEKAAADKKAAAEKKAAVAAANKPKGKVYTAEDVAARIVALDQKLAAKEAKTGSKDRVVRQFLDQAKAQAGAAKTDEDRKGVWDFLTEVDKQLR